MKAWKIEHELLCSSIPVVLGDDEQTWSFADLIEAHEDNLLKMKWKSNVPGSGAPERVIIGAIQSMENMGYDVSEAELLMEEGLKAYAENDMQKLNKLTAKIWNILNNLPRDEKSDYWHYQIYNTWEEIESKVEFPVYSKVNVHAKRFEVQIYYGWLAQIVGGALGTALEGYTTQKLREVFGEIHGYKRKPNTFNDDITYEIAFLKAFDLKGPELTSADIAEEWVALIPFGWSAEEWALRNIKAGVYPPDSGYLYNPYREWIGAQMRGAVCCMVAPGNPREAARLAFMDGVVSHHNNGVLGEIFNAVITSLSYVETDIRRILELAISMIPHDSQYYSVVSNTLQLCKEHDSYQKPWSICEDKYKQYNWIHAYPNAAAEVIALWYGSGDFDRTMHIICMEGQDVDCNAAQIATPIGIIHCGVEEKWSKPIGGDIVSYLRGYKQFKLKELADWTVYAVRKYALDR